MGMANQLSNFSKDISAVAKPLRDLLSTKNCFTWTQIHQSAFENIISLLCAPPVPAHFDTTLPVILQTDASRIKGLGYALLQQQGSQLRLIQCGSRFVSDTESRYSITNLKC